MLPQGTLVYSCWSLKSPPQPCFLGRGQIVEEKGIVVYIKDSRRRGLEIKHVFQVESSHRVQSLPREHSAEGGPPLSADSVAARGICVLDHLFGRQHP